MNMPPITREFIAQVVIAVSVCVGAWYVLVRPRMNDLNTMRTQMAQQQFVSSGTDSDPLLALADRAASLRARIEDIQQNNRMTRDTSDLYGAVRNLANQSDVEILQLQPGTNAEKRDEQSLVTRNEIRMSVVGTYENIATFLENVADLGGFLVPVSLTVSPLEREDRPMVQVNLTCSAMQFAVESVLEKLNGAHHGAS